MEKTQPVVLKPNHLQFGRKNKYSVYPGKCIMEYTNKEITGWDNPEQDGIQIDGNGFAYIKNVVISRKGMDPKQADELASVIHGGDVIFHHCRFADNGKGYLQGTGDSDLADLLQGQRVVFSECIFENNSRRNPFVQIGQGYLIRCLIKNWGKNYHEKSFGVRAGHYGQITISDTVFLQESLSTCLGRGHLFSDIFRQYFDSWFGIPGFARGAYADKGGHIQCFNCYTNRSWIKLENHRTPPMPKVDAAMLIDHLEQSVPRVQE